MMDIKRILLESVGDEDYKGQHQAPMKENGCPLYDMTLNGIYPKDFYETYRHYMYDPHDNSAIGTILSRKGLPNHLVRIYRAIPKDLKGRSSINRGDWVSISKSYALEHGRANMNGIFRVTTKVVYSRDLYTNGDSMSEWGYDPQPRISHRDMLNNPSKYVQDSGKRFFEKHGRDISSNN